MQASRFVCGWEPSVTRTRLVLLAAPAIMQVPSMRLGLTTSNVELCKEAALALSAVITR